MDEKELPSLVIGQNIVLYHPFVRVAVFVECNEFRNFDLILFMVPKRHAVPVQAVFRRKKTSKCGRVVLFGTGNYWLYEFDLSCLLHDYQSLAFFLKLNEKSNPPTDVSVTLIIENTAFIHLGTTLQTFQTLNRIGEVYTYDSTFRFRAYNDVFQYSVFKSQFLKNREINHVAEEIIDQHPESQFSKQIFSKLNPFRLNKLEYKISVIGAAQTGKTSVIAALHDSIQKIQAISRLILRTEDDDLKTVSVSHHLNKMINSCLPNLQVKNPSETDQNFSFAFSSYRIVFQSESGNLDLNLIISESNSPSEDGAIFTENNIDLMKSSDILVFSFDAVALMEENGRYHETVNKVREITDCCKRSLINLNSPKLILLVPIRCEAYASSTSAYRLLAAIEDHYSVLFSFLRGLNEFVAFGIVPIQTLGSILLQGSNCQHTKENCVNSIYSPRNVEQLWIYILSFVFSRTLSTHKLSLAPDVWNDINVKFCRLLSHRKQGAEGFKLIQGFRLVG
ncbi:hypothetical protein HUU62_12005 [Rhodoferax sp. 4810]|uniref:Uncharacterized protein n=1 Tax=Thiospirillum jenense TaxID=1653858 RepID=A0A839HDS1_9GAMM|nr:hypothetical protein [Thiospirillum jenense]MBB1075132.1 hypothetical protein [Rhodoferax jenense]MBB1126781.1 hypothetical protein [Thiospirillum jenense]